MILLDGLKCRPVPESRRELVFSSFVWCALWISHMNVLAHLFSQQWFVYQCPEHVQPVYLHLPFSNLPDLSEVTVHSLRYRYAPSGDVGHPQRQRICVVLPPTKSAGNAWFLCLRCWADVCFNGGGSPGHFAQRHVDVLWVTFVCRIPVWWLE